MFNFSNFIEICVEIVQVLSNKVLNLMLNLMFTKPNVKFLIKFN